MTEEEMTEDDKHHQEFINSGYELGRMVSEVVNGWVSTEEREKAHNVFRSAIYQLRPIYESIVEKSVVVSQAWERFEALPATEKAERLRLAMTGEE
jgi:hypothetical protein